MRTILNNIDGLDSAARIDEISIKIRVVRVGIRTN